MNQGNLLRPATFTARVDATCAAHARQIILAGGYPDGSYVRAEWAAKGKILALVIIPKRCAEHGVYDGLRLHTCPSCPKPTTLDELIPEDMWIL